MIIFEQIELVNFRRYVKAVFNFSNSLKNNLNIILARNGVGKSTLFDAFTWCLFGIEDHLKIDARYSDESEKIINNEVLSLLNSKSPSAEVRVTIYLKDTNQTKRYKIEKVAVFYKGNSGHVTDDASSVEPKGWRWDEKINDWNVEENIEVVINNIIPSDLRQFFFFDGEQLRRHFETDTNSYIEGKIKQVSRTELLESCVGNLDHYIMMLDAKKRKLTTDKALENEMDTQARVQKRLVENKNKLTQKNVELEKLGEQLKKIRDRIKEIGITKATADQIKESFDTNEKLLNEKISQKDALERQHKEFLRDNLPIFFLNKEIKKAQDLINKAIEKKEAPPPITPDYIKRLLDYYKKCICGTSLEGSKNEHRKTVLALLGDTEHSYPINYQECLMFFEDSLKQIQDIKNRIRTDNEQIKNLEEEIVECKLREQKYRLKLGKRNTTLLDNLTIQEENLNNDIERLKPEIALLEDEIENDDIDLKSINREVMKKSKNNKEFTQVTTRTDIAREVSGIISAFKDKMIEQNKVELKSKTEKYLRQMLIEKRDEIERIEIGGDFDLKIVSKIDPSINLKHTLSAGETLIFVLAFAAALRDITGCDSPLIIDTPLGKIDKEYRVQVVDSFPKILESTQLILLVTSSEYTPEVKSKIHSISKNVVEYEVLKQGYKNKEVKRS